MAHNSSKILNDRLQWLLQVSKSHLHYPEQRKKWNEIQKAFRKRSVGLARVDDYTGEPLSETDGIYQD